MKYINQTPHCDSKVLHKPGECKYCDAHPEWQELRQVWGIAFTGHADDTETHPDCNGHDVENKLIPCPSEWSRPVEIIHAWEGNRPYPKEL